MTLPDVPTLPRIRDALAAIGGRPSRRFGQNFLTDHSLLSRMADDAGVAEGDVVLEVGPGPGTLTATLLRRGAYVVAAEVDRDMIALLGSLLGRPERLEVVPGDVLATRPALPDAIRAALDRARERSGRDRYRLVANLPYQIAATFVADLLASDPPEVAVITVQREVAKRMGARPGSREYGPLSVAVQARAGVEVVRRLPAGAFWPPPKVESAAVRLVPAPCPGVDRLAPERLREVTQALFHARRKRVANSLAGRLPVDRAAIDDALAEAGVDGEARAGTLTVAQIVALAAALG